MLFIAIHGYLSLILIFLGGNDAETQKANGAEEAGDADFAAKIATIEEAAEAEAKADNAAAEKAVVAAAEGEAKVDAAAVGGADIALAILMAAAEAKL